MFTRAKKKTALTRRAVQKRYLAEVTGVEYAPSHTPSGTHEVASFPAYFPIASPDQASPPLKPLTRPKQQCARLDSALWPTIAARAEHESLRDLAAEYGVSHETIRAVVRRVRDAAVPLVAAVS